MKAMKMVPVWASWGTATHLQIPILFAGTETFLLLHSIKNPQIFN